MRIKEGYLLREVAGAHVVVPVGQVDFDGMIKLNETGVILWKKLEQDTTKGALVEALLAEYEVDRETAERDVTTYLAKLKEAGILYE